MLLALAGFCLVGCKTDVAPPAATEPGKPAQTVAIASVAPTQTPQVVTATGTVMPWQELTVDAEASGLAVIDVRVKENDVVRAGDILVRLDDRVLKAQVAQQKAAVAEAQANLQSAKQEAARGDALVLQKAMSQESAETRRTAILTGGAKLEQALASLDQLQAQLDQTQVRAPVGGTVSTEPVKIGTVTQAGTELLRIIRDGRLEIQAKIPEQDLGRLSAAQRARITAPDGAVLAGTLRDVAAKLDATTRLGIAYIDLPSGSALRPGMFASAAIAVEAARNLVVPEQALVWPNGRASLFVLGPDKTVSLRALTVGGRQDGTVTVTSGVAAGERVVSAGAGFLHEGDRVDVQPALPADRVANR